MKTKKKNEEESFLTEHVETVGFIVLRDGLACKLVNVSGAHRGGVLMPGQPVISFLKLRDARRAVQRTERVRANIGESMIAEWVAERLPTFVGGQEFIIVPIGRQA